METVREVWVTPLVKVDGVEACLEMVDKISWLLASQEQFIGLERTQPRQLAVVRFSEEQLLYRCRVGEGGMVKSILVMVSLVKVGCRTRCLWGLKIILWEHSK